MLLARPELEDGLRTGVPLPDVARRSGVRTKLGVNMDAVEESAVARLSKEVRIGSGEKSSNSKCPRRAVVGSRPVSDLLVAAQPKQPDQKPFFLSME